MRDISKLSMDILACVVPETETRFEIKKMIARVACQVGDILKHLGKVFIEKGKEILSAASNWGHSAAPYIMAAGSAAAIACALGGIKKYQRESVTPIIARSFAEIVSGITAITGLPEKSLKSITNFLVDVLDITFTILLGVASLTAGALVGY